jgi:hypothetical protein
MNKDTAVELVTRESILKLLSDAEVARVSTAETQEQLASGEEFLDLKHLDRGVRRARPPAGVLSTVSMARVLPKKALDEATWTKIVSLLPHRATP